jgi:hypothetical protein
LIVRHYQQPFLSFCSYLGINNNKYYSAEQSSFLDNQINTNERDSKY